LIIACSISIIVGVDFRLGGGEGTKIAISIAVNSKRAAFYRVATKKIAENKNVKVRIIEKFASERIFSCSSSSSGKNPIMKYLLAFSIVILGQYSAIAQKLDTNYIFKPAIYKNINKLNNLDTVSNGKVTVIVERDTADIHLLNVAVLINGVIKEYGHYLFSDSTIVSNQVYYVNGNVESKKVPFRIKLEYLRQGYWHLSKKGIDIYYDKGNEIKMKIKE
jgi:hypothetical protein